MTKRKWTEEELIILLGMIELRKPIKEICERLDRTKYPVQARLTRYAFKKTFGDAYKWEASNDFDSPLELDQ